jgi:hypothetical protein
MSFLLAKWACGLQLLLLIQWSLITHFVQILIVKYFSDHFMFWGVGWKSLMVAATKLQEIRACHYKCCVKTWWAYETSSFYTQEAQRWQLPPRLCHLWLFLVCLEEDNLLTISSAWYFMVKCFRVQDLGVLWRFYSYLILVANCRL